MRLAPIAMLLLLSCVANSAPSEKMPTGGSTETQPDSFYHPVDHLDVKDREHPEMDPCLYKTCPPGEICRSVRNPYLLQVPIAVCQPEKKMDADDSDGDGSCSTYQLGVNIFNCRSELEWKRAAEAQCALRVDPSSTTAASAMSMFVQVKIACPRNSGGSTTFMQASISCCSEPPQDQNHSGEKTPTNPPPVTTGPTAGGTLGPSEGTSNATPATPPVTSTTSTSTTTTVGTSGGSTSGTPPMRWTTGSHSETKPKPTQPFPTTDVLPTFASPAPTEEETVEPIEIYEKKDDEDFTKVKDEVVSELNQAGRRIQDGLASAHPHAHALWIALPAAGLVGLCGLCCLLGCVLRCYVGRRRQRRALKAFPPDPAHLHATVNDGYERSDNEDDVVYDKKMKPAVVFDPSVSDQLAYDMYIAVKK